MSTAMAAPLEAAVHTANVWLKELREELGGDDRRTAYKALRVVLHALRDRLTVAEVADLGAQLPILIRGLYYEGWRPAAEHPRPRTVEDFLAPIAEAFRGDLQTSPVTVACAVFSVLGRHVSAGEIADVLKVLPEDIRCLWPEGEVSRGS